MQNQKSIPIDAANSTDVNSLTNIVDEYKANSLKLYQFSDVQDIDPKEQEELTRQETALLDRQASLMEAALTSPVSTIDDAKSLLNLWHLDVVESSLPGSLNVTDELVAAAYKFMLKT